MRYTPPPVPPSERPGAERNVAALVIAAGSVAAPALAFIIAIFVGALFPTQSDPGMRRVLSYCGILACVFIVVGLILGVVALVLMKPSQRGTVGVLAAAGLATSVLLIAIFIPAMLLGRQRALARQKDLEQMNAVRTNLEAEASKAIKEGRSVDISPLKQSADKMARESTGEDAALWRVSSAALQKMQTQQAAFAKASHELSEAKVLAASNLTEQAQIQTRKAVVRRFIDANDALETFLKNREQDFHSELVREHISDAKIASAMNGYRKASELQTPAILEIRDTDRRFGETALAILDLFDANWGKWRYDAAKEMLIFNDSAARLEYNAKLNELHSAQRDQAAAQKRLSALLSQSAAGKKPAAQPPAQ